MPSLTNIFQFSFSVPSFVTNYFWPASRINPLPVAPSPVRTEEDIRKHRAAVEIKKPNSYRLPPVFGFAPANPSAPVSAFPPSTGPSVTFVNSRSDPSLGSPWSPSTRINQGSTSWSPSFSDSSLEVDMLSPEPSSPEIDMVDSPSFPPYSPLIDMIDSLSTRSPSPLTEMPDAPPSVTSSNDFAGNRRNHTTTVDLATEIEIEVDDGTLPTGYVGTWQGRRFTIPDGTSEPQCTPKLHGLACGHWVATPRDEQCGINCRQKRFDTSEFACPTCISVVEHVVRTKLKDVERKELSDAWTGGQESHVVGRLVQMVGAYTGLTHDLSAPVVSFVRSSGTSRECVPAAPPKQKEDLLMYIRDFLKWRAEKEAAARKPPVVAGVKRPRGEDDDGSRDGNPNKRRRVGDGREFVTTVQFKRVRTG